LPINRALDNEHVFQPANIFRRWPWKRVLAAELLYNRKTFYPVNPVLFPAICMWVPHIRLHVCRRPRNPDAPLQTCHNNSLIANPRRGKMRKAKGFRIQYRVIFTLAPLSIWLLSKLETLSGNPMSRDIATSKWLKRYNWPGAFVSRLFRSTKYYMLERIK